MSKNAYIFRGSPASGKSTIAPAFCEALPLPVAFLKHDMFRWDIHAFGRGIPDISEEEHALAYRVAAGAYEEYLKEGVHTVVIEGLFTWGNAASSQGDAEELCGLAEQYGYDCESIVLRAAKRELLRRNAARDYSVPQDEFESLYQGVYSAIGSGEIVIDSTGLTVPQTVGLVVQKTLHSSTQAAGHL